jgi:hypothetical protein
MCENFGFIIQVRNLIWVDIDDRKASSATRYQLMMDFAIFSLEIGVALTAKYDANFENACRGCAE